MLWALVVRDGPQDAAAAAALMLVGLLLGHLPSCELAIAATAAEQAGFYAVAWIRRRRESSGISLLAEYGPAEAGDLIVRPLAMTLAAAALPGWPKLTLFIGSCAADALFYGLAAWSFSRRRTSSS